MSLPKFEWKPVGTIGYEKKAYYGVGIFQQEIVARVTVVNHSWMASVKGAGKSYLNATEMTQAQAKKWATKLFNELLNQFSH